MAHARSAPMDLARRMRAGETIITAWSGLPDPRVPAVLGRAGYPAVTFDMQHGLHDLASVALGIPAAAANGAAPIVRLAVDDFAGASRVADMGAVAIIAPMIEDAAGARRLVAHVKYPPLGQRSWGPFEAMGVAGITDQHEWLATANAATLAFAMIETSAAYAALSEILAVEGLDGVFVGPSDLSIALTGQYISVIMTGTGIVALAGIVVNNNIVLIDTYQYLRRKGLSVEDAVVRTAAQRIRPVLLTTATTILGLLPMVFELSVDFGAGTVGIGSTTSDWWVLLSSAVVCGLAFSTVLTLIITPVMLAAPTVLRARAPAAIDYGRRGVDFVRRRLGKTRDPITGARTPDDVDYPRAAE